MSWLSNLINPKKPEIPKYQGIRPYSAGDIGYDESTLKSLANAYLPELQRRAMGEGLVGYDPKHRDLLRSEYLADYNDMYKDVMDETAAQSSGQGLRGGIPMSIKGEKQKDLARAREAGLADIDINDLEARREDINKAFYQQPEEISRGAGFQQNRANFDYNVFRDENPYVEQESIIPSLLTAAGTIGGAYFGGPAGAAVGGTVGNMAGQTISPNKSLSKARLSSNNDISSLFSDFQSSRRRY